MSTVTPSRRGDGTDRRGRAWIALAVGLVVGLVVGLGAFHLWEGASPPRASKAPPTTTPPTPSTSGPASSGGLKPLIGGLVDRNGPPPGTFLGVVKAYVVSAYWSDLEPDAGGPIAPDNAIDQALATVRGLNASHPGLDLALKLRVYGGIYAPAWAKSLGGAPVAVTNGQSGTGGTVGPFWTAPFATAWDKFESELAAKYGGVREIREVVIGGRCSTVFDEPFERNRSSINAFLADGYTVSADEHCIEQEIDEAAKLWPTTRVGMAFNPFQVMTGTPGMVDEAFTEQMMELCRAQLGARCVLENDSIRSPPQTGAYAQMYAKMKALGPPIAFQTATLAKVGNLSQTLAWAAQQGASSVELPDGYAARFTATALQGLSATLQHLATDTAA